MVIVIGPPHSGCLVAVGDGMDATSTPELADWVEVIPGLDNETPSAELTGVTEMEDMVVGLGECVGKSRLGPRGLLH
jgi:hypothetical protein